jgi:hypothetical protein
VNWLWRVLVDARDGGNGRVCSSPRLLRVTPMRARHDATPSAREFGSAWFLGGGFGLDFFANSTEVVHHFGVRKANHAHTELVQFGGAFGVSSQTFRGVMLRAVQLHNQFERRAVEIRDESPNRSLPQPPHRLIAQKLIPELAFGWRQRRPQRLRSRRQPFVIRQPSHPKRLPHPHTANPLPEGVALRSRRGERPARQSPLRGQS